MKAFPRADNKYYSSIPDEKGMDLRDYFAAMAMQGILSKYGMTLPEIEREKFLDCDGEIAVWSYEIANAMMKARDA